MHPVTITLVLLTLPLTGCVTSEQLAGVSVDGACFDASAADNQPGEFQYAGLVACKTTTERHDWTNPSFAAQVEWAGGVETGSLTVRVLDALDREVDSFTVSGRSAEAARHRTEPGFPSAPGMGDWTIELTFEGFTGAMGLELDSGV